MPTAERPGDQTQVLLRLDGHCVETAARHALREHQEIAASEGHALDEASLATLEARLDLLITFLRVADFRALRAGCPWLRGAPRQQVSLLRAPGGDLVLEGEAGELTRLTALI